MELTIDKILIFLMITLLLWLLLELWWMNKTKKIKKDFNIEWYGPDVYLKEKDYGEIKDDYRDKIIEKDEEK